MKKAVLFLCAALCALALTACGGKSATTGWYLAAENGASLIVTEDGGPITLSDQSKDGGLFDGLHSGDRIEITHDAVNETYPAQAGAYTCKLLEAGALEDVPEEALTALEDLGYDFGRHVHQPAAEPQTVEAPVSGYCGNTVTKVTADGEEYAFWGSDSVALTDILENLAYAPEICRCPTEYAVDTEFGSGYGVNLTESFARCEGGQASLTAEQAEAIRGILERNCGHGRDVG